MSQTRICRPFFRNSKSTKVVQVRDQGQWITISKFLDVHFPATQTTDFDNLREWWDKNGKFFNWNGLPTELKDNILEFTIGPYAIIQAKRKRSPRCTGPYEIFLPLGQWRGLLQVSHQVRTLVLELLLDRNPGFLIYIDSIGRLKNTFKRLDQWYQLFGSKTIPKTVREVSLARLFRDYPHQHPHLNHYATFKHGIRRLVLTLDFLDALHFFKVDVGTLAEYRQRIPNTSVEALTQLPNLRSLVYILPDLNWRDYISQPGPRLYDEEDPCPRTLHRWIYEAAATELAMLAIPNVESKVKGFMDHEEKQRWHDLWHTAQLERRFTTQEYAELYAECDGGVELDEEMVAYEKPDGILWHGGEDQRAERDIDRLSVTGSEDLEDVFPPRCICEIPCRELMH
ncbi:hypothetical protein M011DRAFT_443269 [Sporormia fimetaria CBS 119925]|uniref:Uncharacterized protein n=1 Tax=Sporormia fimetaria CBS 119925 TaxID=1340428 RepID=A0A6A6VD04_9PLEO|nr:hypothetical protein M011DRAFT_443269 [Sporormia fimetaria CBS 119925]